MIYIFQCSLDEEVFSEKLKTAKITPLFKKDEPADLTNYSPISVLARIPKILEKLIYNKLYIYLTRNNILFSKQFAFRAGHSTDDAIVELVEELTNGFIENKYALGVFVDLSKVFVNVNHSMLLEKLHLHGVKEKNLQWFESYLSHRKQNIVSNKESASYQTIMFEVPQDLILGPLIFLSYVNDLHRVPACINPIMFVDKTNLFYSSILTQIP